MANEFVARNGIISNANSQVIGALTSSTFVKSGGTSTQYLMADGSVTTLAGTGSVTVSGTGITNFIPKWASSTSLTNSVIVEDLNNNIGIGGGTVSAAKLNVTGNIFLFGNTYNTPGRIGNAWNDDVAVQIIAGAAFGFQSVITLRGTGTGGQTNQIEFATNTAERMRLSTGGNLLINTTTDNTVDKLQVNGSALVNQFKYTRAIDISGQNLDSITDAGFYRGNNLTNAPDTGYFYLTVERDTPAGNWAHQTITSFGLGNTGNRIYSRVEIASVWGVWSELLTAPSGGTSNAILNQIAIVQPAAFNVSGDSKINGLTVGRGSGNQATSTALGNGALAVNTTGGTNNTAIGNAALGSNTDGFLNTAVGYQANVSNTVGTRNTAIGTNAMQNCVGGAFNSVLGANTLLANINGVENVAIGYNALQAATGASNNIVIGSGAGRLLSDLVTLNLVSNNSIFIGAGAVPLNQNSQNEIVIGRGAAGLGSDTVVLGNGSVVRTALRGNVLIGGTQDSGGYVLQASGTGRFSQYLVVGASTTSGFFFQPANDTMSISSLQVLQKTGADLVVGSTNNTLQFRANNAEAFRVAVTTNNILINTVGDTGQHKLQVSGKIWSNDGYLINGSNPSGGTTYVQFANNNGLVGIIGSDGSIFGGLSGDFGSYVYGSGDYFISTSAAKSLVVKGVTRNVLIGTTGDNNVDKLQVNGSLIANIIKKSGGTSNQFLMADGSVSLGSTGSTDTNALHKTGDESFVGVKSSTITGTSNPALLVTNNYSASVSYGIQLVNNGTGKGVFIQNTGGGQGINMTNNGIGIGVNLTSNGSNAIGYYLGQGSTSRGFVIDNSTTNYAQEIGVTQVGGRGLLLNNSNASAQGNPLEYQKNSLIIAGILDNGTISGQSFVKSGGTSAQFLKADGSIDSTTYANNANVLHTTGTETKNGRLIINSPLNQGLVSISPNAEGVLSMTDSAFSPAFIAQNNGGGDIVNFNAEFGAIMARIDYSGQVTAQAFIKEGGSSNEFLMADGSVTVGGGGSGNISGSGTTNFIPRFTSSGNITTSDIYNAGSGLVGIGTTNPRNVATYGNLTIENSVGGSLHFRSAGATDLGGILLDTSSLQVRTLQPSLPIQFLINNIEKARFATNGNFGIGTLTNTPTTLLHVSGAAGTQVLVDSSNLVSRLELAITGNSKARIQYDTSNNAMLVGTNLQTPLVFITDNSLRGRVTGVNGRLLWNTAVDNGVDMVQVNGSIFATTIKKLSGTSTQFLMADGSVTTGGTIDGTALHKTGDETFTGTKSSTINGTDALQLHNNGGGSNIWSENNSTGNGIYTDNRVGGVGLSVTNYTTGFGIEVNNIGGGRSLNLIASNGGNNIISTNSSTNDNCQFINTSAAGLNSAAIYSEINSSTNANFCYQAGIKGSKGNAFNCFTSTAEDAMIYVSNDNNTTQHEPIGRFKHSKGIGIQIETGNDASHTYDSLYVYHGPSATGNAFRFEFNGTTRAVLNNAGSLTATSFVKSGGLSTQFLMADGSVTTGGGSGVSGSGTVNRLTKFTGTTAIGNSNVTDTGTLITLGTNTSVTGGITATTIVKTSATATQSLMGDGSVAIMDSGTWTPTFSSEVNTGGVILANATYIRIGNIVEACLGFYFTPTATTTASFIFTLPVNKTNFATINAGSGFAKDTVNGRTNVSVQINAPTNANVIMLPSNITGNQYVGAVTFQYNTLT